MAAADMHTGKGADDTVTGGEVEQAGEDGALGENSQGDERKPYRHACTQPTDRVAMGTHSCAKERQQCERSEKALGEPQCIVGAQIGIVRSALRPRQSQPEGYARQIADYAQDNHCSGPTLETKID